jgi:hypothetical protein
MSACTATVPGGPTTPRYEEAPCPTEVDLTIVLEATCGFLIVPEDREQPDGRTLRLFVTRVQPPGGPTHPDPMLVLGMDLA